MLKNQSFIVVGLAAASISTPARASDWIWEGTPTPDGPPHIERNGPDSGGLWFATPPGVLDPRFALVPNSRGVAIRASTYTDPNFMGYSCGGHSRIWHTVVWSYIPDPNVSNPGACVVDVERLINCQGTPTATADSKASFLSTIKAESTIASVEFDTHRCSLCGATGTTNHEAPPYVTQNVTGVTLPQTTGYLNARLTIKLTAFTSGQRYGMTGSWEAVAFGQVTPTLK